MTDIRFVDAETGEPCPTRGPILCDLPGLHHRHRVEKIHRDPVDPAELVVPRPSYPRRRDRDRDPRGPLVGPVAFEASAPIFALDRGPYVAGEDLPAGAEIEIRADGKAYVAPDPTVLAELMETYAHQAAEEIDARVAATLLGITTAAAAPSWTPEPSDPAEDLRTATERLVADGFPPPSYFPTRWDQA